MQIESKSDEILDTVIKPTDENGNELTREQIAEQKINEQLISEQDYGAAAGALFALYGTRLYAAIDALSAKQCRRVIKALCVYPLEDLCINQKNVVEWQSYLLANKMIESKFLLTMDTAAKEYERRKEEAEKAKLAAEANEVTCATQVPEIVSDVPQVTNE